MNHRFLAALLITSLALIGCSTLPRTTSDADDVDVARVAWLLTGQFDSRDQAKLDPDNFFEIRLVTIPIWTDRTDGRWLYVEQAAFSALEQPYRQRIYRVHRDDSGQLRSDVYELPGDPLEFEGAWRREDPFASITPDDLDLREGCSILLGRSASGYSGSTDGDGCSSSLRGADYATSEVKLIEGLIVSWDRGWNHDGEQVWGATAGGYEFIRRSIEPPA